MSALIALPTLGDLLKYELNGNFTRETVTLNRSFKSFIRVAPMIRSHR
jgi:hypothetical protein